MEGTTLTTVAVLPVKRFELAKQRLGETLDPAARRALAQAMVSDVLEALSQTVAVSRTVVVTNEPAVALRAAAAGADVIADGVEQGQSPAAAQGIARALDLGATRVLLVPGDCPALDPIDLEALLGAPTTGGRHVTVVPDRHGTGTNALLLQPPEAIEPSFGPGSFERHCKCVRQADAVLAVARPVSLLLDIDTGADLAALRVTLNSEVPMTRARRTRDVLGHVPGASGPAP